MKRFLVVLIIAEFVLLILNRIIPSDMIPFALLSIWLLLVVPSYKKGESR